MARVKIINAIIGRLIPIIEPPGGKIYPSPNLYPSPDLYPRS